MADTPFTPTDILLPAPEADLGRWAVLACDQHTSSPAYWQQVADVVDGAPSTLDIILPEVYLEEPDTEARIAAIHAAMAEYKAAVLTRAVQGFVYVERQTSAGTRQGLVGAVDLEAYDYRPGTSPAIRPSENTVEARIPPRLAVRRGAPLESPHILMLIDDEANSVIEPLAAQKERLAPLYSQQLMLGGGLVQGWAVTEEKHITAVEKALAALADEGRFRARYGAGETAAPFTFAVGDGNHSLATAKAAWEELKPGLSAEARKAHPARWCLVELENIQSPAIAIEPIHRVTFGISGEDFLRAVKDYARENGVEVAESGARPAGGQGFTLLYGGLTVKIGLQNAAEPLAVGSVDKILALCGQAHPGLRVDYIHGEEAVRSLSAEGAVGLLLPPFEKQDLFRGVALGGVLPKKTFSMGHAEEKRYYLECRAIL